MNKFQKFSNYLIKFLWLLTFILLIFIDRNNIFMVISTILLLIIISFVTIVRSLNSRNEWRKMINDGDVEVKDKINF